MQLLPSVCPNCKDSIPVPYEERGIAKWCNTCLHRTIPIVPIGAQITQSGSFITYNDFKSLISDKVDRMPIEKLLKEWFNFQLSGEGREETLILNEQGQAIDPVWLHLKIQRDEERKGEIYNLAMTLWHS